MKLLDLFCGAGGAAMGYHRAGFTEIVGVDCKNQPNYPFEFIQGDALEFVRRNGIEFDLIHASPPCQAYVDFNNGRPSKHPRFIEELREILLELGRDYVIENVDLAPLLNPIVLCGTMFDLRVIRHRRFEFPALPLVLVPPCNHWGRTSEGEFAAVYGRGAKGKRHGRGIRDAKPDVNGPDWGAAMGIDWMTKAEMTQAIPPAYTEFLGRAWFKVACPTANEKVCEPHLNKK